MDLFIIYSNHYKKIINCSIILFFIIQFLNCGSKKEEQNVENYNLSDTNLVIPETEIFNYKYIYTRNNQIIWKLLSNKAEVYKSQNIIKIQGVNLTFYKTNQVDTTVQSKFGEIQDSTKMLTSISNVVLQTSDGTLLYTDILHWDNQRELLFTDQYVKIIRKNNDIIEGIGMEANNNLKKLVILKRVHGKLYEKKK